MERVYVTGARGMVGKALLPVFSGMFEVRGTDLPEVDVTDADAVVRDIAGFAPRIIIHLASMTDVDGCELDPEAARAVNVTGTANVAEAASASGASMVYLSTGMIYNGKKTAPYIEYDRPDPVNVYGRTKYEGELEIGRRLDRYYIFNTCWIFGGGRADKKFVARILEIAGESGKLRVVSDKYGSPTYTVDLARAIRSLIGPGSGDLPYGRYHLVNRGCASRFEVAAEIVRAAGLDGVEIEPVSSDAFDLPAPRPDMEAMSSYRLDIMGLGSMRGWKEALGDYITGLIGEG